MTTKTTRRHFVVAMAGLAVAALMGAQALAQDKPTLSYLASQGWVLDAEIELAKKFEEETGIAIDIQIIPADQYFSVLQTKLNSGEGPDMFAGQSGVSDLKLQYNVAKNAVDLSGEPWASQIDPLVAAQATVDGKLYGLTYWDTLGNSWVINYNKKIFADNGISVPTDYAGLKAACETLLAAGHPADLRADLRRVASRALVPGDWPPFRGGRSGPRREAEREYSDLHRQPGHARRRHPAQRTLRHGAAWAKTPLPTPTPIPLRSWPKALWRWRCRTPPSSIR